MPTHSRRALWTAAVMLLLSVSAHAQTIPPGFVCGFSGPRTPFKLGADTVTFSQAVQCIAEVRTISLSIELLVVPQGSTQERRVAAESIFTAPRVVRQQPYFSETPLQVFHVPCFNGNYFARLSGRVTLLDGSTIGGDGTTQLAFVGNCPGTPTNPTPEIPPPPPLPDIPPMGPMFPDQPTTTAGQVIDMVRGQPLGSAIITLMSKGFRVGDQTRQADPNVAKDSVINGSLAAGTTNVIDLVVSSGSMVFRSASEVHLRCETKTQSPSLPFCSSVRDTPCTTQNQTVVCRVFSDPPTCDAEPKPNAPAKPVGIKQLRCG